MSTFDFNKYGAPASKGRDRQHDAVTPNDKASTVPNDVGTAARKNTSKDGNQKSCDNIGQDAPPTLTSVAPLAAPSLPMRRLQFINAEYLTGAETAHSAQLAKLPLTRGIFRFINTTTSTKSGAKVDETDYCEKDSTAATGSSIPRVSGIVKATVHVDNSSHIHKFVKTPSQTGQTQSPSDESSTSDSTAVSTMGRRRGKHPGKKTTDASRAVVAGHVGHTTEEQAADQARLDMLREQIKVLSAAGLREINLRNRQRTGDRFATASLRDLDLARAPVDPEQPTKSRRPWAPDSPLRLLSLAAADEGAVDLFQYTSKSAHLRAALPLQPLLPSVQTLEQHRQQTSASAVGGSYVSPFTAPKEKINTLWTTKEELKHVKEVIAPDSNAWGSSAPSDTSQTNHYPDDRYGCLLRKNEGRDSNSPLADWEGRMIPPHENWSDRPRFNNNTEEFKRGFDDWQVAAYNASFFNNGVPIMTIPSHVLKDYNLHPDGISMVSKGTMIHKDNASRYGYDNFNETTKHNNTLTDRDFADWGKLDMENHENVRCKDETANLLVTNWLSHLANSRGQRTSSPPTRGSRSRLTEETVPYTPALNPNRPLINIYLRPALALDIPELTRIYNWHVKHGTRTAETTEISESDMRLRFDTVQAGKLPFIVAVLKSKSSALPIDLRAEREAFQFRQRNHPIKNIDQQYRAITRREKIAGFVCAQDLTASDFIEHISAEVELYVDPDCRQEGVGRCLIDKVIECADRYYMPRGGYDFHCAQEIRHMFGSGGGRDMYKIYFVLRKYKFPQQTTEASPSSTTAAIGRKPDNLEDDYDRWLGAWLKTWKFEVEGFLSGVGSRNGRYMDIVYLGRESSWRPAEGNLPGPFPAFRTLHQQSQQDDV